MADAILPRAQAAANGGGPFSREWYDFFRAIQPLTAGNTELQAEIDAILVRLAALEDAPADAATINGLASVNVTGSLESGLVQIQLQGDTDAPGASYYYGTDATGAKGWYESGGGGAGGIGISIGTYLSTATALPAGTEATSIADAGYALTGDWYMWCYPSGSIEIDVWKDTFGNIPAVADSICGGSPPAVVAGTFASGTFTGPVSIARTDTLLAHINSNTNVKWVKLLLIGDKT